MSELGDRYKLATVMVLRKWITDKDELGRSQEWKVNAYHEDKASGRDTAVTKEFTKRVEETVNILELVKPVVQNLCKEACKQTNEPVAVEPITPHGGAADSPHGVDLDWN